MNPRTHLTCLRTRSETTRDFRKTIDQKCDFELSFSKLQTDRFEVLQNLKCRKYFRVSGKSRLIPNECQVNDKLKNKGPKSPICLFPSVRQLARQRFRILDAGGKPSTWFPPGKLVELYIQLDRCKRIRNRERKATNMPPESRKKTKRIQKNNKRKKLKEYKKAITTAWRKAQKKKEFNETRKTQKTQRTWRKNLKKDKQKHEKREKEGKPTRKDSQRDAY